MSRNQRRATGSRVNRFEHVTKRLLCRLLEEEAEALTERRTNKGEWNEQRHFYANEVWVGSSTRGETPDWSAMLDEWKRSRGDGGEA